MSDIQDYIGLEEQWIQHSDGKVYRRWRFIGGPEAWSDWELTAYENIPYPIDRSAAQSETRQPAAGEGGSGT